MVALKIESYLPELKNTTVNKKAKSKRTNSPQILDLTYIYVSSQTKNYTDKKIKMKELSGTQKMECRENVTNYVSKNHNRN